jgi:hypothetical protein
MRHGSIRTRSSRKSTASNVPTQKSIAAAGSRQINRGMTMDKLSECPSLWLPDASLRFSTNTSSVYLKSLVHHHLCGTQLNVCGLWLQRRIQGIAFPVETHQDIAFPF